ncbi:MAG TPA: alpha/beta fold hydrolase [Candidatus Acidoferrales bacterium]|jgi:dipeptidyl aminopeptidase/acylaminoacyl peptidase|nr:alpha/beta fold hydrolase [Candidatus Acidoferrales bacterium]
MRLCFLLFLISVFGTLPALEAQPSLPKSLPEEVREVQITSSKDHSIQPALFYTPPAVASKPTPLLVFLHSWSTDYKTMGGLAEALAESRRRGWAFMDPNFRGPNDHPDACASDLAVADVLDSVVYARKAARIDARHIYLLGSSGGGHMALMMAVRSPAVWTAVSVWVPITDLAAWYGFSKETGSQYYKMMEQCFGGPPEDPDRGPEYHRRSPLGFLSRARKLRITIDAGLHDGHDRNAVPLRQSLNAFNALARANGFADKVLADADVESMTREARIPAHLANEREDDPARQQKILFRRRAGPVTLTIFDGGHSLDVLTGIRYFE